jgi:two-component sensor histidine kinase/PAS domain-containing protein
MGELTRAYDWASTSIGPPETWPQSLRTTVRLVLNTRHPMFIFWGPELIQFYNDAYRQTMGPERHPSALGQRGRECWEEIWDIIGPQIELVMAGEGATWHEDQLVPITRHGRREDVWWTYGYSPIDDETQPGGVGGVLVVCNDVTDQHYAVDALRASEERLQLALAVGVVGSWDWHIRTDRVFADERFARLYNVDPETARTGAPVELFLNSVHPDDSQRLNKAIQKALMDGGDLAEEYRLIQADGTARWVLARGHCFHDDHNQPLRFPGAVIDITERKEAEEHRKLLVNELNHRVKNMLASVQAIANQTLRNGVSIAEGRAVFGDRLIALSRAQDVLIGELGGGAQSASVIKTAIEPLAGDAERLRIDGPGVQLSPRAALSLSMAVHELCTNAAKYGALSKPEGHVDVRWSLDMGEDGERHLSLRWTETGGPTVSPPQRKGFGSRLIEHALATELNGAVSLDYARAGLVCTIEAPLKAVIGDLPLDG